MAESRLQEPELGAPIPKEQIDPELVKLSRARPKIGLVTSAGMVFLCGYFLLKLNADRQFAGEGDKPRLVELAAVTSGKVAAESFVEIPAEPMMSHAIRAAKGKGDPGLRVVPVRGSNERVWLVLDGVGWDDPVTTNRYAGRLRAFDDIPFHDAVDAHARAHPRPVFADAKLLRGAFAANRIKTVDGDDVALRDADKVAFDVIDPSASIVIATFTPGTPEHAALLDETAWQKAMTGLGLTAKPLPMDEQDKSLGQVRFDTAHPVAEVTQKLEGAKLWSARVEPVTRHHETTWAAIKASPATGFTVGQQTLPDAQLDLVGLYVSRGLPSNALALIISEVPQDYWYILPITVVVGLFGLLFLYALVRTIKRDYLPTRT